MYNDDKNPVFKDTVSADTSNWHTITGHFDAEKYPNTPLLDTGVELNIPRFCITWKDKEKLMAELAEVIRKYSI